MIAHQVLTLVRHFHEMIVHDVHQMIGLTIVRHGMTMSCLKNTYYFIVQLMKGRTIVRSY